MKYRILLAFQYNGGCIHVNHHPTTWECLMPYWSISSSIHHTSPEASKVSAVDMYCIHSRIASKLWCAIHLLLSHALEWWPPASYIRRFKGGDSCYSQSGQPRRQCGSRIFSDATVVSDASPFLIAQRIAQRSATIAPQRGTARTDTTDKLRCRCFEDLSPSQNCTFLEWIAMNCSIRTLSPVY